MARTITRSLAMLAMSASVSLAAVTPILEQGRAAINRGDDDAAIEMLERAVAQSPKSAEAHFWLGKAYGSKAQKGGMLGGAKYGPRMIAEFETAAALDPRHVEARYSLVQIYAGAPAMMGGSFDKAFEYAKVIKAIDPVVGHRAYAFIYSQQKIPDLAKKEYLDAIREQPKSPKAHSYFGQYLANVEKDYPAAFVEFDAALTGPIHEVDGVALLAA